MKKEIGGGAGGRKGEKKGGKKQSVICACNLLQDDCKPHELQTYINKIERKKCCNYK